MSYVDAIDVEDVSDDNSNIGLRMSERRRRCDVGENGELRRVRVMIHGSEERFWVIASMAVVDLEMITLREEGLREVFCYDSETIREGLGQE